MNFTQIRTSSARSRFSLSRAFLGLVLFGCVDPGSDAAERGDLHGSIESDKAASSTSCLEANERDRVKLSCPGGIITRINFASFGTPTGSCDAGYQIGTCHASDSVEDVSEACKDKSSCEFFANNPFFGGDPCGNKQKSLRIKYTCGQPGFGPGKVKVFILAGQSNMVGLGVVSDDHPVHFNSGKGNLEHVMRHSPQKVIYGHLKGAAGEWSVRRDVGVRFVRQGPGHVGETKAGGLSVGYGGDGQESARIGPELQIGHVLGNYYNEPVLLIKTAYGGASLAPFPGNSFHPPSSGGTTGNRYLQMLNEVSEGLRRIDTDFPEFAGRGYELSGLLWLQGWNDMSMGETALDAYEDNLTNLILDVRKAWDLNNLPVVIGETGNLGPSGSPGVTQGLLRLRAAQAAAAERPELGERVLFVRTTAFARPPQESPNPGHGHHWFGNAESYFLVGDAMGAGMVRLLRRGPGG